MVVLVLGGVTLKDVGKPTCSKPQQNTNKRCVHVWATNYNKYIPNKYDIDGLMQEKRNSIANPSMRSYRKKQ